MERETRIWTRVHVTSLLGILVVLTLLNRGQWFFGDEWDFTVYRGLHHPMWSLWYPHNEHWSTVPILWWRATFSVFGLKTYWPYLFGLFATHLAVVHGGWRLMMRARVRPALATGVALVMGLYGAGSENLLWAFQVGFVGSLAAGIGLLLLIDEAGSRGRVALVAAGAVVALGFSTISVFVIAAVGLAALARWGWRKALAVTVPAATAYLIWLAFPGRVGLTGDSSKFHGGVDDVPRYVWGGLASTLGRPLHNERVGEALLIVLAVFVALRGRELWRRAPAVLALAATAPLMFAAISQGRGAIQDPRAPRYLYLAAGMLLPLIGYALQPLVRTGAVRVLVAVGACVALAAAGSFQLHDAAVIERSRELAVRGGVLTALAIAPTLHAISDRPDFNYAGDVTLRQLRRLRDKGQLPKIQPTVADIAYAHLALQIGIVRERQRALATSARGAYPAGASIEQSAGCTRVDLHGQNAAVQRDASEAVFSIRSDVAGRVITYVPYAGGNAGGRIAEVEAGEALTFHDTLDDTLVLQLPGPARICGITWAPA